MINQLKNDYIELFKNDESVKEIDETYNGEYKDIIVKKNYEIYPKISYPGITIQEISNEDVNRYWDGKENVSYVAYQITIYAIQSETLTAEENVERLANILDTYMKQDRYKCMRRIGSLAIIPMVNDDNVITGNLRYEGYIELNTNTIYRRN